MTTMQKPLSPVNFINANPAPAARKPAAPDNDGAQFTQALKREVAQRNENAPAKVKQATAADAPPRQAAAKADKSAQARQAAPAEQARKAQVKEKQEDADAAAAAAAASAAAADAGAVAVNPMVDMLAMVASFKQPQQAAAQVVSDPLAGAGAAAMDSQLAALQSAAGKQPGAPLAGAEGAAAGADGGKLFNMMARMDAPVDDSSAAALSTPPELLTKADAQGKAGADPSAVLTRAAPEMTQIVRRDDAPRMAQAETAVSAPLSAAVQQASLTVAQAANAAAGDKIAARVGTPGWDNQVAQKIIYMVGGQDMSASLTLNPPDLGPMQVVLNVNNDHADVTFSSAQPEVRQALEDALPKLREMMSESGLSLGNASVNDGAQQQAQEQMAQGARGRAAAAVTNGSAAEAEAQQTARATRTGELPGLVNTFA